jgi:hypothetical protein
MTRDEAIRAGISTLAQWHRQDHGDRCVCTEEEQLGDQSVAIMDALIAEGIEFDGYAGRLSPQPAQEPSWSRASVARRPPQPRPGVRRVLSRWSVWTKGNRRANPIQTWYRRLGVCMCIGIPRGGPRGDEDHYLSVRAPSGRTSR